MPQPPDVSIISLDERRAHDQPSGVYVEAIWVRRIGDKVQILFESSGKWRLAIDEHIDASFSHIAEYPALENAPEDQIDGNPFRKGGREWVTP